LKKTTRINNWLSIRNDATSTAAPAEIMIYDQIGKDWYDEKGLSAQEFDTALKGIPKDQEILVRINSPGGNVWDGLAIYNMLKGPRRKGHHPQRGHRRLHRLHHLHGRPQTHHAQSGHDDDAQSQRRTVRELRRHARHGRQARCPRQHARQRLRKAQHRKARRHRKT
jgi:hypothetical protein